jgi:hypothetical protein
MLELKRRAEQYLRKAAEFALKAESAVDADGQNTYRNLADSYRRLSRKVYPHASASDAEIEALARRMVEK